MFHIFVYGMEHKEEELTGKNPFDKDIQIEVCMKSTNEIIERDGVKLFKDVYYEYEEFTKMFAKPVNRKLMMSLSDRARTLILYIMYMVRPGKDYIKFNRKHYMEEQSIKSQTTIIAALNELAENGIICPAQKQKYYWINPMFFFKGNRIAKFPHRLIEK